MEELFKVLLLQPRRVLATSFFDCQMARIIWILVEVTFNMYNSSDWSSPSFLWLATGTREETKRQALVGACAICYLDKVFFYLYYEMACIGCNYLLRQYKSTGHVFNFNFQSHPLKKYKRSDKFRPGTSLCILYH